MVTRRVFRALAALAIAVSAYPTGYIGGGDLTLQIFEQDCSTPKSFPSGVQLPTNASTCLVGSAPDGNALAVRTDTCCSMGQDLSGNGQPDSFSVGGDSSTSYGKFVCGDDGVANIFLYQDDQCTVSSAPSGLESTERGTELNTCKPLTLHFADANEPSSPAHEMFVQHQLVCRQGFPIWIVIAIPVTIIIIMTMIAILVYVRRVKKHKKDAAEQQRVALWRRWAAARNASGSGQGQSWAPQMSWNQWRQQPSWNPWAKQPPARQQPYMHQQPQSWHPGQQQMVQMHHPAPAPHQYVGQAPVPRPPSGPPRGPPSRPPSPMPRPPVSQYGAAQIMHAKGKGSMKGKGKGKGGPMSAPPTPQMGPMMPGKGKGPMSMMPGKGKGPMIQGPPSLASSVRSQRGVSPFQPAMNRGRSPGPAGIHRPTFRPSSLPPSVADRDEVLGRSRLNSFSGPQYSARGA